MASTKLDWKANEKLPVGKGATFQQWVAAVGGDKFEMDVAPWGEGYLKINDRQIAHVNDAKDRRRAFGTLNDVAERYLEGQVTRNEEVLVDDPCRKGQAARRQARSDRRYRQ